MTKSKMDELDTRWKEHNAMLKRMGLPKETFEQFLAFVHGKQINNKSAKAAPLSKSYSLKIPEYRRSTGNIVSSDTKHHVPATLAKKEPMQYTGTLMKGVATMHKSNSVPVFSDEEAVDIAHMRR